MTRSIRAAKLFLCAGALAAPLLIGSTAAAASGDDGWGRRSYSHSHHARYAGCLTFNGRRYNIECSDRSLYDIGRVFKRHGYGYSVRNNELIIRIGYGYRRPSIGWASDLHRASIAYRGDCIVIKLYDTANHKHDRGRRYDRYDKYDRYDDYRYRRYERPRRYYRPYRKPYRPSRCW